jgi:predicted transcriptional regulator
MPINFHSKLHKALLDYYFSNPESGHYVRELSRDLSFSASLLSRELGSLSRLGIFVSSMRGREKYFRLNRSYPLYNEFRKIIQYIVHKK